MGNSNRTSKTILWVKNIIFTLLHPGIVVGFFPMIWLKSYEQTIYFRHDAVSWLAYLVFMVGLVIYGHTVSHFVAEGKGTLSPLMPTKNLVTAGCYKYTRNPMYTGVKLMLIGECIYFGHAVLWMYTIMIFLVFYLFVRFYEEPRLLRDFGETYVSYCNHVPRWIFFIF